uniref:E2 ubiquitin-conjugating enzyme n=2 Tax=Populus trichocarpa TaxID=3694 RepID=A0A2K2CB64_POPTR|eukprot:XP_024442922.1 probable ubiquitin-conjugating enzyme E2 25 [Populus trichocarpa]
MKPPPPLHIPLNSKKKRVFMDPDVIEVPPPPAPIVSRSHTKQPKNKQVILHEIIDVDKDEDAIDVMILDKKNDLKNKGKSIKDNSDGYSQAKDGISSCLLSPSSGENNIINMDGLDYDDGTHMDLYPDDFMDFDEYSFLQSHFDKVDIPPGVEAPIPWLPNSDNNAKKSDNGTNSFNTNNQMQSNGGGSWSLKPGHVSKKLSSVSGLSFHNPMDSMSHDSGVNLSPPWPLPQTAQGKEEQNVSQHGGSALNFAPFQSKIELVSSSSLTDYGYAKHLDGVMLPHGVGPAHLGHTNPAPPFVGGLDHFPIISPSISSLVSKLNYSFPNHTSHPNVYDPFDALHIPPEDSAAGTPKNVDKDDILRKFQQFKQFDTVEDHSDHHYTNSSSMKQSPKTWAKRIQDEWRILENDLPDSIFVRVYETRMDLLRAVIIGAEGTPYHDGLFFFDVFFPAGYPKVPPLVYYHSGGLRLNPNLYSCGKVCLSLLGTWQGNKNEMWQPGVSTVLQVLVSIQALILNQKPFFNEPGYERLNGSANGEKRSQEYSESTFCFSLKTMAYTMRRPPKHFEDFVLGHFHKRANDILVACKAYMDGAQVGCLVNGGVQDVDEGDKSCSKSFKDCLPAYIDILMKQFSQIGVQDTEKFRTSGNGGDNLSGNGPMAAI